ncbi:MAG: ABC transporter ATP-binding protein [Desulfovibrionaceae bacterium]|nr:ABC transporter ATP-binding protein [Desulfovibrionaceae bacterium]
MSSEPAGAPLFSVTDLSKAYRIYDRPLDRVRQGFARPGAVYYREHWALREASFTVAPGEAFGVIGRNGAGKSTLLTLMAGVLRPTSGTIKAPERLTALLELGSGFNPKLTGRQNVFLNGAILGLTRRDIAARLESIREFADIGEYFDEPVKTYSSGMFLRLAFAVTTGLTPDALIVDEALAVGDVFFRQKCHARMEELLARGGAVILVSHAMNDVAQFCHRALLLNRGRVEFLGDAGDAVKRYLAAPSRVFDLAAPDRAAASGQGAQPAPAIPRPPDADMPWPEAGEFMDISRLAAADNGASRCLGLALCDENLRAASGFHQGETAQIFVAHEILRDIEVPVCGAEFTDSRRVIVFGKNTLQYDCPVPASAAAGAILYFRFAARLDLAPGEYTLTVGFTSLDPASYANRAHLTHQALDEKTTVLSTHPGAAAFNVTMRPLGSLPVQLTHHGVANLPGEARCAALAPRAAS